MVKVFTAELRTSSCLLVTAASAAAHTATVRVAVFTAAASIGAVTPLAVRDIDVCGRRRARKRLLALATGGTCSRCGHRRLGWQGSFGGVRGSCQRLEAKGLFDLADRLVFRRGHKLTPFTIS